MTVAFQRMFGILKRWNNNQVTPSLSKPHELSYRFNIKFNCIKFSFRIYGFGFRDLQIVFENFVVYFLLGFADFLLEILPWAMFDLVPCLSLIDSSWV